MRAPERRGCPGGAPAGPPGPARNDLDDTEHRSMLVSGENQPHVSARLDRAPTVVHAVFAGRKRLLRANSRPRTAANEPRIEPTGEAVPVQPVRPHRETCPRVQASLGAHSDDRSGRFRPYPTLPPSWPPCRRRGDGPRGAPAGASRGRTTWTGDERRPSSRPPREGSASTASNRTTERVASTVVLVSREQVGTVDRPSAGGAVADRPLPAGPGRPGRAAGWRPREAAGRAGSLSGPGAPPAGLGLVPYAERRRRSRRPSCGEARATSSPRHGASQ